MIPCEKILLNFITEQILKFSFFGCCIYCEAVIEFEGIPINKYAEQQIKHYESLNKNLKRRCSVINQRRVKTAGITQ